VTISVSVASNSSVEVVGAYILIVRTSNVAIDGGIAGVAVKSSKYELVEKNRSEMSIDNYRWPRGALTAWSCRFGAAASGGEL
jgi:hypothetical protein